MKTVVSVLTSYNRCVKTVQCISAILKASLPSGWKHRVVLVDDASADRTAQIVAERFPQVTVLTGDGNLYWNGGMRMAMQCASNFDADVFVWVNDDLELSDGAYLRALLTLEEAKVLTGRDAIAVGSVYSSTESRQSYGAVEFPFKMRPTTPRFVYSAESIVFAESMNGNFVAISRGAYECVGELDPDYVHTMSDFDYGLRASRLFNVPVAVIPGFIGFCDRNPVDNTYRDRRITFRKRWRHLVGPKGRPFKAWFKYTKSHSGIMWPAMFLWPYVRVVLVSIIPALSGEYVIKRRDVEHDRA